MATLKLSEPPQFTTVRSVAGAVSADPLTVNITNYPQTLMFDNMRRVPNILVRWTAGGTVNPHDFLDLQLLVWNQTAWEEGPTVYGVKHGEVRKLSALGAANVALRVVNAACAAGTNLVVSAAEAR